MALISYSIKVIFMLYLFSKAASAQLSKDYYAKTCPEALSTVRTAISKSVMKEHRMGASLLRLHFHDCFVNGCDGSVLLDDTAAAKGEKTAAPNVESLRGFEVIDTVKSKIETICPGVVSCSDILALAARDSVVTLGGPSWAVELGRRDSATASFGAANTELPSPILDVDDLITFFSLKGFTAKEMVALSGGHTTGKAKCVLFRNRIYNETDIDSSFATSIKSNCPSSSGDDELSSLDTTSPVIFDNGFFKNLVKQKGLLHSDQQLFSNGSTDSLVATYTKNAAVFFEDFAAAMLKMGRLGPLTGTDGQIRADCRKSN